jgi:hypothetical protein
MLIDVAHFLELPFGSIHLLFEIANA